MQCTVGELKDRLVPLVECPRERHHLIYNGRVLLDAAVLQQEGLHINQLPAHMTAYFWFSCAWPNSGELP